MQNTTKKSYGSPLLQVPVPDDTIDWLRLSLSFLTRGPLELLGYVVLGVLWLGSAACVIASILVSWPLGAPFSDVKPVVKPTFFETILITWPPFPLWSKNLIANFFIALLYTVVTAPAWIFSASIYAAEFVLGYTLVAARVLFEFIDSLVLGGFIRTSVVEPAFPWLVTMMARLHIYPRFIHDGKGTYAFSYPLQRFVTLLMLPTRWLTLEGRRIEDSPSIDDFMDLKLLKQYSLMHHFREDLYLKKTFASLASRLFFTAVVAACIILPLHFHLGLWTSALVVASILTAASFLNSTVRSFLVTMAPAWSEKVGLKAEVRKAFAKAHPLAALIMHGPPVAALACLSLVWLSPMFGASLLSPLVIGLAGGLGLLSTAAFIYGRVQWRRFLQNCFEQATNFISYIPINNQIHFKYISEFEGKNSFPHARWRICAMLSLRVDATQEKNTEVVYPIYGISGGVSYSQIQVNRS